MQKKFILKFNCLSTVCRLGGAGRSSKVTLNPTLKLNVALPPRKPPFPSRLPREFKQNLKVRNSTTLQKP